MKKIDVAQTIAVLANVGVLAGIVFLSLELRQNNEQLTAQSRFNYYQNRIAEYWSIAENGELAELMHRATSGEELLPFEMARVTNRMYALITGWEYEFGEMERGRLLEEEFNVEAKRRVYRSLPALEPVWNQYKGMAPPRFAEFMDRNITNP